MLLSVCNPGLNLKLNAHTESFLCPCTSNNFPISMGVCNFGASNIIVRDAMQFAGNFARNTLFQEFLAARWILNKSPRFLTE